MNKSDSPIYRRYWPTVKEAEQHFTELQERLDAEIEMDKKTTRRHTFIDATFGEGQILNSPCAGEFRVNYPCITLKNEDDLELSSRACPRCESRFVVIGIDVADGLVELIGREAHHCPCCGNKL